MESLCAAHQLPEGFEVVVKQNVHELLETFFIELREPGVERLGIIVDANGSSAARWESIRHTLHEESYPEVPQRLVPTGMIVPGTDHRPLFGAWVMPDNGSLGALEEFASALIPADDRLWGRAAEAIEAIPPADRRFPEARRAKAHIHTWLAWREYPGSPMGQAITKGDLDAGAPLARRFVGWLRRLMIDAEAHPVSHP